MQADVNVQDGRLDFDFWMGKWKGFNRRLNGRLKGATEWEEFECTAEARKILNGLGNFDEVTFNRASGKIHGGAMRLFDVATQQWRIYWADGSSGILDVPMVGSFKDGRGTFYAQEMFEGQPIFSRFIWIPKDDNNCRWEQAFSPDGGASWETNWTMDYTRIE
ncbi:MAG: DUF1579 domain-containing protein [Burkholderiales bacterium]|nr:DUF1579 domain-containing protein [Anaerolineae bacterium]